MLFSLRDEFRPPTFWILAGDALCGAGLLTIASRNQCFSAARPPGAAINAANEFINPGAELEPAMHRSSLTSARARGPLVSAACSRRVVAVLVAAGAVVVNGWAFGRVKSLAPTGVQSWLRLSQTGDHG